MRRFLDQPAGEQRLAFTQVAERRGLTASSVEKDLWVCWTLAELYALPELADHLTFKGGTSLSLAWGLIDRFSEDLDLTIARAALGFGGDAAPERATSRKQQSLRLKALKTACRAFIQGPLATGLEQRIGAVAGDRPWRLTPDAEDPDGQTLLFDYPSLFPAAGGRQVKAIAGLLEEKASIPMVQQHLALIHDVQSDEWWQDVTLAMLEIVRKRLRALVKLIDKRARAPIYTDFADELGGETPVELPAFASPDGYARFRAKARAFLRQHEDHLAIHKLRTNVALTQSDLDELERMLTDSGVGAAADVEQARRESHGLGLFVRSLVGLDREAAKQAFAGFLGGRALSANQIEFVNLIIDHLTEHGVMGAELLYESPFTDLTPRGPDDIFSPSELAELLGILEHVQASAVAA